MTDWDSKKEGPLIQWKKKIIEEFLNNKRKCKEKEKK